MWIYSHNVQLIVNHEQIPTLEEVGNDFFSREDVRKLIDNDKGVQSENLKSKFNNFIAKNYVKKYNINASVYTSKFKDLALKYCIQFHRVGKNHYISKDLPTAKQYMQELDECIINAYEKNKSINYNKFERIYNDSRGNSIRITKPIVLSRFNSKLDELKANEK